MASNYTPTYGLNQWSLEDSVLMADFNEDNAKIEQALTALDQKIADTAEQVKADIPRIQIGTYVGTGTYGEETPCTLTFDFRPKLVILSPKVRIKGVLYPTVCIQGVTLLSTLFDSGNHIDVVPHELYLSWEENTLSWYSNYPALQYNEEGVEYSYLAIG